MKTAAYSDVADYTWLTGDEACAVLRDLAASADPIHAQVAALRRSFSAERTHLLLEQVELRRRAAAKFTQADRMFFTRVGLEQATDQWVAAYKASRFTQQRAGASPFPRFDQASPRIADLCCGIGGDLAALGVSGITIGVDRDPMTAHFAAVNSGAAVQAVDIADFDLTAISAFHIDPDRRASGNRTTTIEAFEPDGETIERLLQQVPNAAVKLAPATKVPVEWEHRCELEWISRDGQCRQLVAWHGDFAEAAGKRRATVLSSSSNSVPTTIVGIANQRVPIVDTIDRYLFDVDAAVLAAHLKGAVASSHSLSALSIGSAYLTGPRAIDDAAITCFELTDILPLETRKLARELAARGIGQLEIKKRGVEIDPQKLRRDLKLRGDNAATLLLCRVAGRGAAVLAKRVF